MPRHRVTAAGASAPSVGGYHPPYSLTTTNSAVASASIDGNGGIEVGAFSAGVSTITVTGSTGNTGTLPVYVTTLQVSVTFSNLPSAYSLTLMPTYGNGNYCSGGTGPGQTISIPQPAPSQYTFTFVNDPSSLPVLCSISGKTIGDNAPLISLSVTVSNNVSTIASASTSVSITPGTSNTITLNPQ